MVVREDLEKALERPQNVAIIKFLMERGLVDSDEISKMLGINTTMTMLYLSDLEKVGILIKKTEEEGEVTQILYKLEMVEGLDLDSVLTQGGGKLSQEKIAEAIGVYLNVFSSIMTKLDEVGGQATLDNIIAGIEDVSGSPAMEVIISLDGGTDLDSIRKIFLQRLDSGELKVSDFTDMKSDFINVLKKIIGILEKFMGKLYGQHLTKNSLKPVVSENMEIITELDLLAGLPRDYLPAGGG